MDTPAPGKRLEVCNERGEVVAVIANAEVLERGWRNWAHRWANCVCGGSLSCEDKGSAA